MQLAQQRDMQLEELGDEIARLAAHIHAATYELLVRLREFDQRNGWTRGFRSCAHWLSWRTGIAPGAAREKLRVARALAQLPLISEAMRTGEMSYAKVRAMTRVATPHTEADLLHLARHGTAAHVEKVVRAWRLVDRLEERRADDARHRSRHFIIRIDDTGMYEVSGRLEPETGALLQRLLDAGVEALYGRKPPRTEIADESTAEQRRADAVSWLLERSATADRDAKASSRFNVVIHVDESTLHDQPGQVLLDNGVRVSAETCRRIGCDATRRAVDAESTTVSRSRGVSPAMRTALEQRDRGCRFPGCGLRFCDAHHIQHWADGGETRLENLVSLCRRHHRLVHEGGFRVQRTAAGEYRFFRPDGRELEAVPPAPQLGGNPIKDLMDTQQSLPIEVSCAPQKWNGERLDLDWAIVTLRRRSGRV